MKPFDFLGNLGQSLNQYFQPSRNEVGGALQQFFPSRSMNFRLDKSPNAPDILSLIEKTQQSQEPQQPQPTQTQVTSSQPTVENYAQPPIENNQPPMDLMTLLILLALQQGGGFGA